MGSYVRINGNRVLVPDIPADYDEAVNEPDPYRDLRRSYHLERREVTVVEAYVAARATWLRKPTDALRDVLSTPPEGTSG